jgi:hypothetical protein
MSTRVIFALVLALASGAAQAQAQAQAQDARWLLSGELGAQAAPARTTTAFNPAGGLLDARVQAGSGALNLKGQFTNGPVRGSLNLWVEHQVQTRQRVEQTRAQPMEALLDLKLYEGLGVGLGQEAARGLREGTATSMAEETSTALGPRPGLRLGDDASVGLGLGIARWGTGYAWNPANPVQDPEANNTSRARPYRRTGDGFVRIESSFGKDSAGIYLTRFLQNDPLLSPRREREWWAYGRYQHVRDGGDLTGFVATSRREQFIGAAASATWSEQLELHAELGLRSRRRAPQVLTLPVNGPDGARTLALWNFAPESEPTVGLLAGAQYTFENKANLIVEYLYNGNGLSRPEFDRLRDAAAASQALLASADLGAAASGFLLDANRLVGRMRRHYLFLRLAREELLRDTDLHYYLRVGLQDGAQIHGLFLSHAITQRTRAQLGAELYTGPGRSEASLIPVRHRVDATLSIDF